MKQMNIYIVIEITTILINPIVSVLQVSPLIFFILCLKRITELHALVSMN